MINQNSKPKRPRIKVILPVHTSTVEYRIKKAKQELGISSNISHDDRWNAIKSDYNIRFGN